MKDGVEIEISEGELRLRGLAGVGRVGIGEDLAGVGEYVVEEIILKVLTSEGVAVRVLEGDDLFLLLLLVRGGGCSGHRWAGGGDAVVVVVNCQTCPNREESDRQPQDHHHHSGNHAFEYNIRFLRIHRPFARAGLLSPWPPCRPPYFSIYSFLQSSPGLTMFSSSTNQTQTRSDSPATGPPPPTPPPSVAPTPSPPSLLPA